MKTLLLILLLPLSLFADCKRVSDWNVHYAVGCYEKKAVCLEFQDAVACPEEYKTIAVSKKRQFLLHGSVLLAGTIFDIETTEHAIDNGAQEFNPIMRPFAGSRLKSYAFRMGMNALLFSIAWRYDKPWMLSIAGTAYGVAGAWNLRW